VKKVGIFYRHLEYITAIWCILWPFDNLVAVGYISPILVGIIIKEKSGNPGTMSYDTIRHNYIGLILALVAWCRTTSHSTKIVFRVNTRLSCVCSF
jgi:hypothetical protein